MTPAETRAIVTVSLLAAFVDGEKHERERAEIKRIAEGLSNAEGVHLPTLYQDVLMKRVTLAGVLPALASEESRQLAYEMAVCVCDADGAQSAAERAFLAELSAACVWMRPPPAASRSRPRRFGDAPLAGEAEQPLPHRPSRRPSRLRSCRCSRLLACRLWCPLSRRPLRRSRPLPPSMTPCWTRRSSTPPSSTARSSCCPSRCRRWPSSRCR
jgi:hypothetical protein